MADNEGFAYAYGWNVYYQRLFGLWAIKGEGSIARQRAWLWVFIMAFCIWMPQLASLSVLWGDLNAIIDCLCVTMSFAVAMAKIAVLQCQRRVIGSILTTIAEDWEKVENKKDFQVMLETAKISRFISIVSVSITNFLFIEYIGTQFWMIAKNGKDSTMMDPRLANGFLFITYFPFDTTNRFIFASIWLGQLFGSLLGSISYAGPDCLVSMVVLHLCGQLRIVRGSFRNIVNKTAIQKPERYWQRLSAIVKRHEQINNLAFVLRDAFSSILLLQMLACSVTFCFQGYIMFTTLMDRNGVAIPVLDLVFIILYGVDTVAHLFFYCYVGDRLLIESTSISNDFYETEWYNLASKEAKAFLIVCHRSKSPLEIKAGKFCTFNLQLFNVILRSSMGYLSMLMAMKDRFIERMA